MEENKKITEIEIEGMLIGATNDSDFWENPIKVREESFKEKQ